MPHRDEQSLVDFDPRGFSFRVAPARATRFTVGDRVGMKHSDCFGKVDAVDSGVPNELVTVIWQCHPGASPRKAVCYASELEHVD
jgi:hypothetical protein